MYLIVKGGNNMPREDYEGIGLLDTTIHVFVTRGRSTRIA